MSDLPPEIIERMRIHRSQSIDEDGPYESGDHDFENDALTIIDAYLAENDPTPIDKSWLVSIGGDIRKDFEYRVSVFFRSNNGCSLYVSWCPDDKKSIPELKYGLSYVVPVPTRGTFRTAMRLFGIEIEEKAQ